MKKPYETKGESMKRKYGVFLAFVVGFISGCILLISIGMILLHRDKGTRFIGPKVYGDVLISPSRVDKSILPDVSGLVYIECKENEIALCLYFGDGQNLVEVSLLNGKESLLNVSRSHLRNDWRNLRYGNLENENYVDINFDGSFDFYSKPENTQMLYSIYIDNRWIKVTKCNFEKATLKTEEGVITYLFSDEKGWYEENIVEN
jgi:hypothetical protein